MAVDCMYVNENTRMLRIWPKQLELPKRLVDVRPGFGYASTYKIGLSAVSSFHMNMLLRDLELVDPELRDLMDWDSRARRLYVPDEDDQSLQRARRPRTLHGAKTGSSRPVPKNGEDVVMRDPRKSAMRSYTLPGSYHAAKRVRFEDQQDPIEESYSDADRGAHTESEAEVAEPPRRKKAVLKKATKDHEDGGTSDEEPHRRSMTQCVAKVFSKVANAPQPDVTNVGFLEYAPLLPFVPPMPTLQNESKAASCTKLSLATQTFLAKDSFDKKGVPITLYDSQVAPEKYLATCAVRNKPGQHRLAMASVNENVHKVVDDFHKKWSDNCAALQSHMDVSGYPLPSRNLVSEALHSASKAMIGECDLMSLEVCVLVMNHLLRSGKWCTCACEIKGVQHSQGRSQRSSERESPAVPARQAHKFLFSTERFPAQSTPTHLADPKLCFPCVNKLFAMGKLKEGENPPSNLWFDGWLKLNEHRASSECLDPKPTKPNKKKK
jgi:hypothetical protein